MVEKAYEKHAWLLILAIGIISLLFSFMYLLGMSADPYATMYSLERAFGLALLLTGVLTIALVSISFRKGERGAWYALWILPIGFLGYIALNLSIGGTLWPIFIVLFIITLLGLLIPYRKFFPKY